MVIKTRCRSGFPVIIVLTGVKKRNSDIFWEKKQFLAIWYIGKWGTKFRGVFEAFFCTSFSSQTTIYQFLSLFFFVFGLKPWKNASIQAQPEVASSIRWRDISKWRQIWRGANGQFSAVLRGCLVFLITSKRIEPETWGCSSFIDIFEKNMQNSNIESTAAKRPVNASSEASKIHD